MKNFSAYYSMLTFFICLNSLVTFGQIEINFKNESTNLVSSYIPFYVGQFYPLNFDVEVHNLGQTEHFFVTRKILNYSEPTWLDSLCWGHQNDLDQGFCYTESEMYAFGGPSTTWISPDSITLETGEYAKLKIVIDPRELDWSKGDASFQYLIGSSSNLQQYQFTLYIDINSLGLTSIENHSSQLIYPNPVANYLNIKQEKNFITNVKIYNNEGRVVLCEKISELNPSLCVSTIENGIYFVEIGDNKLLHKINIRH